MKRKISLIKMLIFLIVFLFPCAAFAGQTYVYDKEDELSASQIKILETRCSWLESDGAELIIVIDGDKRPETGADAFSSKLSSGNGLVLYIDEESDSLILKAYGNAKNTFPEETCAEISRLAQIKLDRFGEYDSCQSTVVNVTGKLYGEAFVEGSFYRPAVCDYSGVLNENENTAVKEQLEKTRNEINMDVAVIVEDEMWGSTAEETADDYYDYLFYGAGEDDDGILLYISMDERKYQFSTYGDAIEIIGNKRIEELKNSVAPYLSEGKFADAFITYGKMVEYYAVNPGGGGYDGNLENRSHMPATFSGKVKYFISKVWPAALTAGIIFGIIMGLILTSAKKRKMNNAVKQTDADAYLEEGSVNLKTCRDIYLYSNVIRTPKPQQDSGTHMSSGGRFHGGGGGSF